MRKLSRLTGIKKHVSKSYPSVTWRKLPGWTWWISKECFLSRLSKYAKVNFPQSLLDTTVAVLLNFSQISLIFSKMHHKLLWVVFLLLLHSVFVFLNQFDQRYFQFWQAFLARNPQIVLFQWFHVLSLSIIVKILAFKGLQPWNFLIFLKSTN